jgi:hypothetical protein
LFVSAVLFTNSSRFIQAIGFGSITGSGVVASIFVARRCCRCSRCFFFISFTCIDEVLFSANICFSISNFACSLAASENLLVFDCNVSPLGPAGVLLLSSLSLLSSSSPLVVSPNLIINYPYR